MDQLISEKQTGQRERTLLTALLLSSWGPLTTGLAVAMSQSTTQVADFVRRTVDLIALFVSWFVYRHIRRQENISASKRKRLERTASLFVAGTLILTGVIMSMVMIRRGSDFQPGGTVWLGLFVASAGALVNAWFWRRYASYNREQFDPILQSQARLYRAKTLVDLCVLTALVAVAIDPTRALTRLLDLLGSTFIALYLLWSGLKTGVDALAIGKETSS